MDLTNVRRKNRQVHDDDWIKSFLHRSPAGTFAFSVEGQPYLNNTLFIYDEEGQCIYFHTAGYGNTRAFIEQNSKCCFSIFEMGRLLPGKRAIDFSTEYSSVVAFGDVQVVNDPAAIEGIFQKYFKKYSPHLQMGKDFESFTVNDALKATMFCFHIRSITGKMNKQPEGYPGAYSYYDHLTSH